MKFFGDFGKGLSYFFRSWKVIFNKGMWHFLFYPLLLKVIFYVLVFILTWNLADWLYNYLSDKLSVAEIPDTGTWWSLLKSTVKVLLTLFAWLVKFVIWWLVSILMKYIILAVLSPVLSLASEIAEEKLTGKKYPFSLKQLLKDMVRGTLIALRNMFMEYLLFFAGFLLFLVPVLGPFLFMLYGIFMCFVSWYYYGFSMLDYGCERRRMGVRASTSFIRRNKGIACGIGFMYSALLMIPFIGEWIGLMFAPIMGVIGGTIAALELFNQEETRNNVPITRAG